MTHATSPFLSSPVATGDRLVLRDHVVEAEIGAFQQERGRRQRLTFDLVAECVPSAAAGDDVDQVLSYDLLHEAVAAEIAGRRFNLLETLAEGVAARVLAHAGVASVDVSVAKLDICAGLLGVQIRRTQGAAVPSFAPRPAPPGARLLLLPDLPPAPDGGRLAERLHEATAGAPLLLCVDGPPMAPEGCPAAVARRIDLLGFEQAAWRLAARDPRFVVTASRTELDWGLRHGQWSVWAPSKLVVDARGDAPPAPARMPTLARWLAGQLGIATVEVVPASAAEGHAPLDPDPLPA